VRALKVFETENEAVLTADDAALIAPDFGCNAIMNEEAAFDIYPPCALLSRSKRSSINVLPALRLKILFPYLSGHPLWQ